MYPVLFEIGPLKVYSYGLMMALGILAAIFVARKIAPKIGIDSEKITDMATFAVLGGLVGSYVNFVISYDWSKFTANPLGILRFWEGGLVFLGGLIGGTVFAILYIRRQKWPLWEVADICAISVPLAYGFGRIGCFFAGCCYGIPSDLPWAITFPKSWAITFGEALVPRHPTQIYSMLLGFGLAAFAYFFRKKRRFAGQSFLFYLFLYGLGRGIIEFFRINPTVLGTRMTVAQFTGLLLMIAAAAAYPILRKRNKYTQDTLD
ncbi:MAG: prolipoprotein diacylglyceryl transferase [Eubacteriales bacterium]|nr:prolipoprotein diacylglyceryl transferase [Eubacteriales bacterium]